MSRVMALLLVMSLWLPAQGQSQSTSPRGRSTQFSPRDRSAYSTQSTKGGRGFAQPQVQAANGFDDRTPPGFQGLPPQSAAGQGLAGVVGATGTQGLLLDARAARAAKGRLPNGFGQLGLSQDQRERIYGIRELYRGEIDRLETLVERLKAEEELQYQHVLSPTQRQALLQSRQD